MERVQWNKTNVLKLSLNISVFCGWNLEREKIIIILNDQLFYSLSTAIVILIVIVITIKYDDQKNEIYWQNVFNLNHSPIAINSLITQSACVYLDLLPHFKRMLTEMIIGRSSTKYLFFMPIGNPRWLPPQVIVLTQDHMGKMQKYVYANLLNCPTI